jgi:hypothetical protein
VAVQVIVSHHLLIRSRLLAKAADWLGGLMSEMGQ